MKKLSKDDFYKSVKEVLEAARSNVYRAVNFAIVEACVGSDLHILQI
jgi:hypothetical protein